MVLHKSRFVVVVVVLLVAVVVVTVVVIVSVVVVVVVVMVIVVSMVTIIWVFLGIKSASVGNIGELLQFFFCLLVSRGI